MNSIIISAVGSDRLGIVSEISGVITNHGGNVEESRMSRIGSDFAIIEAAIDDFTLSIFDTSPSLSGDLNGDGILNVLDVVALVNFVLSGGCPNEADINADNSCNVQDVVILVNLIFE
jgi:hypothetical protein